MNTLLFVYNAHSGKLHAMIDGAHKLFSPNTYKCSLCALTHDTFVENNQWKEFRTSSKIDMEFYHIDEFERVFPQFSFEYPVILKLDDDKLINAVSAESLNKIASVENLIDVISNL